ncbi:MAG: hypothetical protein V1820_05155 [archaeon]
MAIKNYRDLVSQKADSVKQVLSDVFLPAAEKTVREVAWNKVLSLGFEERFGEWSANTRMQDLELLWDRSADFVREKFPSDENYFGKRFEELVFAGFEDYSCPEGLDSTELGLIKAAVTENAQRITRDFYRDSGAANVATQLTTKYALAFGIPAAGLALGGLVASAVTKSSLPAVFSAAIVGLEAGLFPKMYEPDWAAEVSPKIKASVERTYLTSSEQRRY